MNANELTLGPGTITILENSFLFEANDYRHIGFDLSALRFVRARSINGFDVAYSFQGLIQKASFESNPKYIRKNEAIERDVTTDPLGWAMAFWKLHTITGAVVARIVVDRSNSQNEGLSPMADGELEEQLCRLGDIIRKFPLQKNVETGKVVNGELNELERQLSNIWLKLTNAWLMGNLSQQQRVKVAAMSYLDDMKRYQLGWYHPAASEFYSEMTNQDYRENAEAWLSEEMNWGSDLREVVSVQDCAL